MKHGWELGIALAFSVAAEAADPPPAAEKPGRPAATAPAAAAEPGATTAPAAATAANPQARAPQPLDLRIGNVRSYMMPREYAIALGMPDADKDAIVVEGQRELLPMQSMQPIPGGMPLLPLWWAVTHPSQSWRILVPDLNRPPAGPPVDKIPPPVFRWGP